MKPIMSEQLLYAVVVCAENDEFVAQWARLRGVVLPADPISQMVDKATEYDRFIFEQFVADVQDLVVDRLPLTAVTPHRD